MKKPQSHILSRKVPDFQPRRLRPPGMSGLVFTSWSRGCQTLLGSDSQVTFQTITFTFRGTPSLVGCKQCCATRCILASGMQGNGERMRKWREIHSLHLLIISLFPPSLSISYIKICHILSQSVKYDTLVANVTKNA